MTQLTKNKLRQTARERRQQAFEQAHDAMLRAVSYLQLSDVFQQANNIACYLSYKSEFPTEKIIELIWQENKNCFLPVIEGAEEMAFVEFSASSKLSKNKFGIYEPLKTDSTIKPENLDLVIAPLLAFDSKGHRLGTGKGYYDRVFSKLDNQPYILGLAFSEQEFELVPTDEWDVNLDAVLTEQGLRIF